MKDEPMSTPIPEQFKPHNYYKDELENAKEYLKLYQNMSIEEAQINIDIEYRNNIKKCKAYLQKERDINDKYTKVLNEVKAWNPPTSEYTNLKDFAIQQITMCMSDVNNSYYLKDLSKPKPEAAQWIDNKIKNCKEDIKRYTEEWNKEVKRTNESNKWLKELRESL